MSNSFLQEVVEVELEVKLLSSTRVGGGCINNAEKIVTSNGTYFIKWNDRKYQDMFLKETKGLSYLESHSKLRIPNVISQGILANTPYLLMEWIESGPKSDNFWSDFGRKLAHQHKQTSAWFGLDHDNYIGILPQSNKKHSSWYEFFISERLEPQIELAIQKICYE